MGAGTRGSKPAQPKKEEKMPNTENTAAVETPAPAAAAPAVAATASGQGQKVILPSGEARVDYCQRRFKEGISRGEIAKELTKIQGKAVAYQIVFAATKHLKGKHAPAVAAPTAPPVAGGTPPSA